MADTTGMDNNRFGMSVKQTTDVHGAGKKKQQCEGCTHTDESAIGDDGVRMTPVFEMNARTMCAARQG
jgi:hypothetical protein